MSTPIDTPEDSDLPAASLTETPAAETPATANAAPPARRGWKRYLVYALAVLGVLFVALVGAVAYDGWKRAHAPIPEDATIEENMTEVFGRYSDEHKGWLYVADSKRTYLMTVVQQASIDNKQEGDGLYFVASGTPMDDKGGTLYGVFYLHKDAAQNDALVRAAQLYEQPDVQPLTPEHIRFEALSKSQWAWVIKQHNGTDEPGSTLTVTDVFLAPHRGEIKEIANFIAQIKYTPEAGCAQAEADYAQWLKDNKAEAAARASSAAAAPASEAAEAEDDEGPYLDGDPEGPTRCEDQRWTYRTDAPKDKAFSPLYITRSGLSVGEKQPDKTWKVMFNAKGFAYQMPKDLF